MDSEKLKKICIQPDVSIRQAISAIDQGGMAIALVVDGQNFLQGTITDGDIRRAMLSEIDLDTSIHLLLERKTNSIYPVPITAPVGTSEDVLVSMMKERVVRHIPLLDEEGKVTDLALLDDLLPNPYHQLQAVVMAGGSGTRLRPLTEDVPKPMLLVGGQPLMELIIKQLQSSGIQRVNVTTHYKPERIIEHFGNGEAFGLEINYVNEDQPLGTGGALGLLPHPSNPILVINGDILTKVDFRSMLAYHQEHQADLTVAVRKFCLQVPYGVIECDGPYVSGLKEKPDVNFLVNAGIYILEPGVYQYIPNGERFNMTDLIQWLINDGKKVASFLVREYWLDIGQHSDYEQAQFDMREGKL